MSTTAPGRLARLEAPVSGDSTPAVEVYSYSPRVPVEPLSDGTKTIPIGLDRREMHPETHFLPIYIGRASTGKHIVQMGTSRTEDLPESIAYCDRLSGPVAQLSIGSFWRLKPVRAYGMSGEDVPLSLYQSRLLRVVFNQAVKRAQEKENSVMK